MLDGVLGYSSLCMGAAQQTEKATGNGFKGGKKLMKFVWKVLLILLIVNLRSKEKIYLMYQTQTETNGEGRHLSNTPSTACM